MNFPGIIIGAIIGSLLTFATLNLHAIPRTYSSMDGYVLLMGDGTFLDHTNPECTLDLKNDPHHVEIHSCDFLRRLIPITIADGPGAYDIKKVKIDP